MMDTLLSDFDSFSESSSSDDQDDTEFVYGGQACSILSSLEETIGKIDDFLTFERGFVHGDIVCTVTDPSGQMGRVINVDMIVDLENVQGTKIKHVNSEKLQKIRSVSVGDFVVGGPWLGKIDNIVDYVTILFDDGTKCEYSTMGPEKLLSLSPDLLEDSQYPYYPGQRVRVELSSIAKSTRWLCGRREKTRDEGTVCAVDAGMVYVDWLGCAVIGAEKMAAPPRLQNSKNLTLLSCFTHANWQLGDWCTLPIVDDEISMERFFSSASTFGLMKGHTQSDKEFQNSLALSIPDIFVIVKTMTKVDVLWQDGSQSFGLDSQSLYPINIVDAHDFWPNQYVLEKGTSDDPHVTGIQRWGVVRCVDAKERTVKVKWESCVFDLEGEGKEEIVSAYELVEHPDYSYCLGDAVFGMQKDQFVDLADGRSYMDHVIGKVCVVEVADLKDEVSGKEYQNVCFNNKYLSRIGTIVGFDDGNVEVKWGTGIKTKVAPYEIYLVEKYEGLSVTPVLHDENVEEPNEEMTEHVSQSIKREGKDLLDSEVDGGECQNKSVDFGSLSLPRAAIGFFTNIAASVFGSLGSASLFGTFERISENRPEPGIPSEMVLELCSSCTAEPPFVAGDMLEFSKIKFVQKVKETQRSKDFPFSSSSKYAESLRRFDMVSGCSDHHFVNDAGKGITSSQMKRVWLKKVQQEWSILEKDLPETIYVRIYEERMDILRAAIIGAPGTPYHDGLFFFDIFLPPEYPNEPPLVHYNSGGLRVNPNLYESGKVCLSLLNTWTGSSSEVWNPGSSTILQVLLSLQALVLNEKPYFNEAGYDKQMGRSEGEKNSVSYNENAFIVSCKSMLYVLRKPPKHFEELVEEHFSKRCKHILQACKAYMEGVPVGCASGQTKAEQETQKGSSTGFKIMLGKLFPKLVEAFSEKGIDCSKYSELEE